MHLRPTVILRVIVLWSDPHQRLKKEFRSVTRPRTCFLSSEVFFFLSERFFSPQRDIFSLGGLFFQRFFCLCRGFFFPSGFFLSERFFVRFFLGGLESFLGFCKFLFFIKGFCFFSVFMCFSDFFVLFLSWVSGEEGG